MRGRLVRAAAGAALALSLMGAAAVDRGPSIDTFAQVGAADVVAHGGALYVSDPTAHVVRRIAADGTVTIVAGTGTAGFSGDGAPATHAELNAPSALAVRPNGDLYVADTGNHRVRLVSGGTITTVVGTGTPGEAGDGGQADQAQLDSPSGLAVHSSGRLYVADTGNGAIREVRGTRIDTVVAGLSAPRGLALDLGWQLYVADSGDRRVLSVDVGSGAVSLVAGVGSPGVDGDGGAAVDAALTEPSGVELDGGRIWIADRGAHVVRVVDVDGRIRTVAGRGAAGSGGDGGPAVLAWLSSPTALAVTGGTVFVADTGNARVRWFTSDVSVGGPWVPAVDRALPAGPANDNHPRVSGTAPLGSTVSLHADATCTGPPLAAGPAGQFETVGLEVEVADDSATTLYAVAHDAAGVTSPCSPTAVTYVEDSTPPSAPAIVPPSSGDTDLTWTFTTESGAATECRLLPPGADGPFTACTSSVPALTGEHRFEVRAIDAAGNVGEVAAATYEPASVGDGDPVGDGGPDDDGAGGEDPVDEGDLDPVLVPAGEAGGPADGPDDGATPPRTTHVPEAPALPEEPEVPPGVVAPAPAAPVTVDPRPVEAPAPPAQTLPVSGNDAPDGGRVGDPVGRDGQATVGDGATVMALAPPASAVSSPVAADPSKLALQRFADATLRGSAFPAALAGLVLLFLALQDRIDRREPKLALAPLDDDPDLDFRSTREGDDR